MTGLREPLEGHARLQEPFPASQIQQLPQGGIKLDYVSHGNVTKRLLEVDPNWNWEPLAYDEQGLPLFDNHGGLWIKLTVLGITRLGYGEPQGRDDYDKTKGAIGNAIRIAAMRFGVALDLWARDVPSEIAEPFNTAKGSTMPRTTVQGKSRAANPMTEKQLALIKKMIGGNLTIVDSWKQEKGIDRTLTSTEASELIDWLKNNLPQNSLYDPWADIPKGGADETE